jgi:large subunit ribosomal protein L4e
MARGHKVEDVPELPLVVGAGTENVSKTKNAIDSLKDVGAYREVDKVKDSKNLRRGKGKMRNRRYQQRKGPLVVYSEDSGLVKAFRNLPGIELRRVDQLNLLQLAPGGHMGRFVVWTKPAFEKLDSVFGTFESESLYKKGWKLPKGVMQVPDLHRLINSDEIQSVVKPPKEKSKPAETRTNPLRRHDVMAKLNPHVEQQRKEEKETNEAPKSQSMKKRNKRERLAEAKEAGQRAIKRFKADAEYVGEYFGEFATWIGNKTKSKGAGDNDGGGGDGDSDSSDD